MTAQYNLELLANEIRQIYGQDTLHAESRIEELLESSFDGIVSNEKIALLDELISKFKPTDTCTAEEVNVDQEIVIRIFSLLLGKKVTQADLSSAELLQRLADSLNTMFDMMNQLVGVINKTFLGCLLYTSPSPRD